MRHMILITTLALSTATFACGDDDDDDTGNPDATAGTGGSKAGSGGSGAKAGSGGSGAKAGSGGSGGAKAGGSGGSGGAKAGGSGGSGGAKAGGSGGSGGAKAGSGGSGGTKAGAGGAGGTGGTGGNAGVGGAGTGGGGAGGQSGSSGSVSEDDAGVPTEASVVIGAPSGSTLAGTATFTGPAGAILFRLSVTGAPVGEHGVHIHMTGDCGGDPFATNAGAHWDPATTNNHGAPGSTTHLGDLGNLTVASDGTGVLEITKSDWKVGSADAEDVVGKAVVIHTDIDDELTQPTGNSGGRIGCGVIQAQ